MRRAYSAARDNLYEATNSSEVCELELDAARSAAEHSPHSVPAQQAVKDAEKAMAAANTACARAEVRVRHRESAYHATHEGMAELVRNQQELTELRRSFGREAPSGKSVVAAQDAYNALAVARAERSGTQPRLIAPMDHGFADDQSSERSRFGGVVVTDRTAHTSNVAGTYQVYTCTVFDTRRDAYATVPFHAPVGDPPPTTADVIGTTERSYDIVENEFGGERGAFLRSVEESAGRKLTTQQRTEYETTWSTMVAQAKGYQALHRDDSAGV